MKWLWILVLAIAGLVWLVAEGMKSGRVSFYHDDTPMTMQSRTTSSGMQRAIVRNLSNTKVEQPPSTRVYRRVSVPRNAKNVNSRTKTVLDSQILVVTADSKFFTNEETWFDVWRQYQGAFAQVSGIVISAENYTDEAVIKLRVGNKSVTCRMTLRREQNSLKSLLHKQVRIEGALKHFAANHVVMEGCQF